MVHKIIPREVTSTQPIQAAAHALQLTRPSGCLILRVCEIHASILRSGFTDDRLRTPPRFNGRQHSEEAPGRLDADKMMAHGTGSGHRA